MDHQTTKDKQPEPIPKSASNIHKMPFGMEELRGLLWERDLALMERDRIIRQLSSLNQQQQTEIEKLQAEVSRLQKG